MGVSLWIIIGALAGWIAEKVTRSDMGLIMNIVVGIVGAFIGGWIFGALDIVPPGSEFVASLITAVVGAVVLLLILKLVFGRR
jgi:uncharacterized membrane protein YeaQ/YmgE (transglycosylase-associated protein family)